MNYMTVEEFADEIKMCPASVRKAIRLGKIYAIRFGVGVKGPYRIPITELERMQIASMYGKKC